MPDPNDILRSLGPARLRSAIENAEEIEGEKVQLELGSDREVAECVARDLRAQFSKILYTDGEFYAWRETHWAVLTDKEIYQILRRYDGCEYETDSKSPSRFKLNDSKRKSILKLLASEVDEPDFFSEAPIGVSCRDGFIMINKEGETELRPHDPEQRQRHYLDINWSGNRFDGIPEGSLLKVLCDGCFKDCPEQTDKIAQLGEIAGAAIFELGTIIREPKAIVFYGPTAANGKSQWLKMISAFLPRGATSSITPSELEKEQRRAQLVGVRLNFSDELGYEAITSDKFKAVVSGDRISGKVVYKEPIEFSPTALHVFATNVLPTFIEGMDRGVRRRLHLLSFERTITPDECVVNIGQRIATEEAELLLAFMVDGARRLSKQQKFTETASGKQRLAEWILESDQVSAFFEDSDVVEITGEREHKRSAKDVYKKFRAWAESEGIPSSKIPNQSQFTRRAIAMNKRGLSISRTGKSGNIYYGISLR